MYETTALATTEAPTLTIIAVPSTPSFLFNKTSGRFFKFDNSSI